MNDADRKAFEQKYGKADFKSIFELSAYELRKDAFKAACEWRDSQVGEPVAMSDAISKHQTDAYAKLTDIRNAVDSAMIDLLKANHALAAAKGE